MRQNEFKLECMVLVGKLQASKDLIDFGVFEKSINVKHGDYPEIIIDKDIAAAILKKIVNPDGINYKHLFEKYLDHIQEMYGHACLDDSGYRSSSVVFTEGEKEYIKTLDIIN